MKFLLIIDHQHQLQQRIAFFIPQAAVEVLIPCYYSNLHEIPVLLWESDVFGVADIITDSSKLGIPCPVR